MIAMLLFFTAHTFKAATLSTTTLENMCPSSCKCFKTQITCVGLIPKIVSDSVEEVILSQIHPEELYRAGRFCNVYWLNVRRLTISSVQPVYFYLGAGTFNCLSQLKAFSFHSAYLENFSKQTFAGLTNVEDFDLSACMHIHWQTVYQTLSDPTNLPKLTHLNLSAIGINQKLDLGQDFINALGLRPIKSLDLSFNAITFGFSEPDRLCDTLTTLILHNAIISNHDSFLRSNTCGSLQTLDYSSRDWFIAYFRTFKCVNTAQYIELTQFYSAVSKLYLNAVVEHANYFTVQNCSLYVFVGSSITDLYFSNNILPNFDIKLENGHLKFLDLSHNRIENINPNAFRNLKSLQRLNISHNYLSKSASFAHTFSVLFKHNRQLIVIDLSFNNLTYVPEATFSNNNQLQELYLSGNSISHITFDISHLSHLTVLDLRFNSIKTLGLSSRWSLDSLFANRMQPLQSTANYSNTLPEVLLEGNYFSCECSSLDFMIWFTESPLFQSIRESYFCEWNEQQITMTKSAVIMAQQDCEISVPNHNTTARIALSITAGCLGTAILVALIVCTCCKTKGGLDQRRLLYDDNKEFRFPVFLSYSSQDTIFVTQNVLLPLQVRCV